MDQGCTPGQFSVVGCQLSVGWSLGGDPFEEGDEAGGEGVLGVAVVG